jgi:hypothetical protein
MATITAGDYTCEFKISADAYETWKNEYYLNVGNYKEKGWSPALALKDHMAKETERILDHWIANNPEAARPDDGTKKKKKKKKHGFSETTKVADIVFAFNNSKLIVALRERGAMIAANNFDGMRKKDLVV